MMHHQLASWHALQQHALGLKDGKNPALHLRNLLTDQARVADFRMEFDGTLFDYSRSLATSETKLLWLELARETNVADKIQAMVQGQVVNVTEKRQVLHTALRCSRGSSRFPTDVVKSVSSEKSSRLRLRTKTDLGCA